MSNPSNCVRLLIIFVIFVAFAPARGPLAVFGQARSTEPPPPAQAQQRPVFRGGTHFVRVDAYPVENGKIVERYSEAPRPPTMITFAPAG